MDHKTFMSELQRTCKLDKQQCAVLLKSFEEILQEEAINMTRVHVDGLGIFASHKHPEFVQENEETHEMLLYPPRISFRFQSEVTLDK